MYRVTLEESTVFCAVALTAKDPDEKGDIYIGSPARKQNRTEFEQFQVKTEEVINSCQVRQRRAIPQGGICMACRKTKVFLEGIRWNQKIN